MRHVPNFALKNIFKPIPPLGNSRIENMHSVPKITLTKLLESIDLQLDELLSFVYYWYSIFSGSCGTEPKLSFMFGNEPAEG